MRPFLSLSKVERSLTASTVPPTSLKVHLRPCRPLAELAVLSNMLFFHVRDWFEPFTTVYYIRLLSRDGDLDLNFGLYTNTRLKGILGLVQNEKLLF